MNQLSFWEDKESPKGFLYLPSFISMNEEAELLYEIHRLEWQDVVMHGVKAKRKVAQFGMDYRFGTRQVNEGEKIPDFLHSLISKIESAFSIPRGDIEEVLVSHYPPGAPIGWHLDAPMFEKVIGVSLLSNCEMRFRKKEQRKYAFKKNLQKRSAYLLSEEARWLWQHHIPPVLEERYSVTFRTLRHKY